MNGFQFMKKILIFITLILCIISITFAQKSKIDKVIVKASQFIQSNNERNAIETLENAIKDYPNEVSLHIFLAEIYFNKKDFENSILYYDKAIAIDRNYDLNAYYRLGIMQKQIGKYTTARRNFQYYVDNQKKPRYESRIEDSKYNIACIDFITEQLQKQKKIDPISLGENINDTDYQYLPTLTLDNELYFTQRKSNAEDFYFATLNSEYYNSIMADDGSDKQLDFSKMWNRKQKLPPPLNTAENEGAMSVSPDGRYIYFAKCNAKDGYGSCDIYRSKRVGNTFSKPENLGNAVNSNAWDSQPSIASDGRTLFFASNREGGFGQSDIWYSYLKDDGTWTKAKNCGHKINTAGNEITPYIHHSNTTLYFSSDSLIGMGGQDIYFSKIVDGKFEETTNLGYPINTLADETCFIVSAGGDFAIYSKQNAENDFDLYAFDMDRTLRPTKVVCLQGKVSYDDEKKGNESVFEIRNLRNSRLVASTSSDKATNMYKLALVVGEHYAMNVSCNGYLLYSENFSIEDIDNIASKQIIEKNILMQSVKEGSRVVLKNVFFATNSFELQKESDVELKALLKLLKENPKITIEISGYTDNVGNEQYNLVLSERRANSVKNWLIENGIDESRLRAKGYGMANSIADNSTEYGRKQNRRTEFRITAF